MECGFGVVLLAATPVPAFCRFFPPSSPVAAVLPLSFPAFSFPAPFFGSLLFFVLAEKKHNTHHFVTIVSPLFWNKKTGRKEVL